MHDLHPPLLQAHGQHLPHPGLARLPAQAEAVDLVPKLDSVGWVDVTSTQVPQVDPGQGIELEFLGLLNPIYLPVCCVQYEEDTWSGCGPDHLDNGLIVHSARPGYQGPVIGGAV